MTALYPADQPPTWFDDDEDAPEHDVEPTPIALVTDSHRGLVRLREDELAGYDYDTPVVAR